MGTELIEGFVKEMFKTINATLTAMRDAIDLLSKQIKELYDRIDLLENDHHYNS